eukprot:762528-Hanusia_phi.AAC.2
MEKGNAKVASKYVEAPPPVEEVPLKPVHCSVKRPSLWLPSSLSNTLLHRQSKKSRPHATGMTSTRDQCLCLWRSSTVTRSRKKGVKLISLLNKAFFNKSEKKPEKEPINIKIYAADSLLLFPSGRMVPSDNLMNDVVKAVPMRDFDVCNHTRVVLDEYELKRLQKKRPDDAPDFFAANRESKEVNVLYGITVQSIRLDGLTIHQYNPSDLTDLHSIRARQQGQAQALQLIPQV